ncbi:MAG: hypothetical protein EA381_05635 [Planctomycetaceae bacterium]|nr:MAG: hypothetical protein EA381_05635 [Planctomycetaceae bacterium]
MRAGVTRIGFLTVVIPATKSPVVDPRWIVSGCQHEIAPHGPELVGPDLVGPAVARRSFHRPFPIGRLRPAESNLMKSMIIA